MNRLPGSMAGDAEAEAAISALVKSVRPDPTARRRKKLWELPAGYHCPVIGTCLTLDECRKLLQRARLRLTEEDEYGVAVHSYLVKQSSLPNNLSRATHKLLDRKYAGDVNRFARFHNDDELLVAWCEASKDGRIAGAFWAIVTHPAASRSICDSVFGIVHMMSHLQGSDSREREKRAAALSRENERLKSELSRTRHRADEGRKDLIARLRRRQEEAADLRAKLAAAESSRERPATPSRRHRRAEDMAMRLKAERARARRAEADADQLRQQLAGLKARLRLTSAPVGHDPEDPESADLLTPEADLLAGRTVLYLGGSVGQKPRLRDMVERLGGSFCYHDGGLEDGHQQLEGLVRRADAVFCPIDCVSHTACLRAKELCQRLSREFLPLRNRGTATFARAVLAHYQVTPGAAAGR